MNSHFENALVEEMEKALSRLESMGTILASLCGPDREMPDLTSLADLGHLIAREAMDTLNLVTDEKQHRPGSAARNKKKF